MKLQLGRPRRMARKTPARVPDGLALYAIGDVHGRADLLAPLLDALLEDAAGVERAVIVGLGDYVDRGPDSRGVVDLMLGLANEPAIELRCLRGNHDQALVDFLADAELGPSWARHGGRETLASYGTPAPDDPRDMRAWRDTREAFAAALPDAHRDFFADLALSYARGDYLFVHAGVRPGVALDAQAARDLLWIREPFLTCVRPLEKLVVHGHTPSPRVHADHRRIGLDTEAHASGVLSACRLEGTERRVIQAVAGPGGVEIRLDAA
ncbi:MULTISPECIES: metallophosphoesterase family protein [unclassified Caulobacter]|uniref:metallophosphoesterase family protein n=1 Tax=unclassified Caulobacter TaxID=2648921 RepID=UPI001F1865CF|nr:MULTISPECIES: metallophosphoesterase family protein [unclassified Caulobacter]